MSIDLQVTEIGYLVNHIEASNHGDLCNLFVTKEILEIEDYAESDTPLSEEERKRKRLFDIGADKGAWALMALAFCPSAEILCFEPNPFTFEDSSKLQMEFSSLHWYNIAISDSYGTMELSADGPNSNCREPSTVENLQHVEKRPLEKFLEPSDYISLMKIDTEGHDIIILKSILPFVKQFGSIVTEFSVYWYGKSIQECIQNSVEILIAYSKYYKYIYFLSRIDKPFLILIANGQFEDFCFELFNLHLQTDICFTNHLLTSLPVTSYEYNRTLPTFYT